MRKLLAEHLLTPAYQVAVEGAIRKWESVVDELEHGERPLSIDEHCALCEYSNNHRDCITRGGGCCFCVLDRSGASHRWGCHYYYFRAYQPYNDEIQYGTDDSQDRSACLTYSRKLLALIKSYRREV
jgi:hypothetical protein